MRDRLGLLGLLALGLVTWWLRHYLVPPEPPTRADAPPGPDYILSGARLAAFETTRGAVFRLEAERLLHDVDTHRSELEGFQGRFIADGQARYTLSAAHGVLYGMDERLQLSGDVVITGRAGGEPLRLETPYLLVFPKQEQAVTQASVTLSGSRWQSRSRGLRADLSRGEFEQLADVRGVYRLDRPRQREETPPAAEGNR